ncbi:MAG: pilus assembly protein [Anaerolineales bacterium]|nr:pilus assembly protein [Anaerolineales bacterium]
MRKIVRNLFSFKEAKLPARKGSQKSKAQSLVEFAITLPIILILLTGVVEFGFALNYYLSLLDATREAARFGSGLDPFTAGYNSATNNQFYSVISSLVASNLDPRLRPGFTTYEGRRIQLDPASDDVIITVYGVQSGIATQFPPSGPFRLYGNQTSMFNTTNIQSQFQSGSPNAGVLVVEVHYTYHHVLRLPWLSPLNPMTLRAYTIMPLGAAEP